MQKPGKDVETLKRFITMIKKVTGTCLKKLRQMVKIGHFGSSSEKGLFEWSNFFLVQKRMRRTVCIFFGICCLHPSSKNDHWIFEMLYHHSSPLVAIELDDVRYSKLHVNTHSNQPQAFTTN